MASNGAGDKPETRSSGITHVKPITWTQTSRTALLTGIQVHKKLGAVEDALKREEAVRLIERAWFQYRGSQKRIPENPHKREKSHNTLSASSMSHSNEHWLWKSLRSYSKEERKSAASLLLDSMKGPDLDYQHQRKIPPLVRLLQRHVVLQHNPVPAQVALEWVAILQSMLSSESRCFLPYWDWVTQAIWRCANRRDGTALCALTNLAFQLSIQTSSPNAKEALLVFNQNMLWGDKRLKKIISGNEDESSHKNVVESVVHISPLARLIGAYFCIAAAGSQLTCTPSARNEALSMLEQLVDPAVAPSIIPTSTVPTNKRENDDAEDVANPSPRKRRRTVSLLEGYDSDFTHTGVAAGMDSTNEAFAEAGEFHGEDQDDEEEEDDESVHETESPSENSKKKEPTGESHIRSWYDEDDDEDDEDEKDEESEHGNEDNDEDQDEDDGDQEYDHIYSSETVVVESEVEESDDEDENDIEIEDEDAVGSSETRERSTILGETRVPGNEKDKRVLTLSLHPPLAERQRMYIAACMEVLTTHYPPSQHSLSGSSRQSYLHLAGEHRLIKSINGVIKPQKNPLDIKVVLRRAPTQEEFFRGSLSQNPVPISALKPRSTRRSDTSEPTIGDLRQHIADDLQMSDSAELIEILVANKILDTNLKLRVVHQVLWRQHLIEQPSSGIMSYMSNGFFSRGSGLSIFFSSDRQNDDENRQPNAVTEETPASELPSLLATYRLAGVDGEATEDTVGVNDIVDPESPLKSTSPEEKERQLEAEYGNTRLITDGKGVYVLLRSIQHSVLETVRKVYRDDVGCNKSNPSRLSLRQRPPCETLQLLHHCAKLQQNRKRLLQARAPTMLLTLLLEVLKALEGKNGTTPDASGSCPTAELLQELIESLTSDISVGNADTGDDYEEYLDFDASSMPLLLTSIELMCLSAPLRRVIAKLLPFLTYGRKDLSRELAHQFDSHICLKKLGDLEACKTTENESILVKTLVDTLLNLPPNDICNSLRDELINCGFVQRLVAFVMKEMPQYPPTWTAALWPEGVVALSAASENNLDHTIRDWRALFARLGIRTVFKILTGLCQRHAPMQQCIAVVPQFLRCCHWIEATSDNTASNIATSGLGLLAETLLDELGEGNADVSFMISSIRNETKLRKKTMALQRRKETMLKMGVHIGGPSFDDNVTARKSGAALSPALGLTRDGAVSNSSLTSSSRSAPKLRPSMKKQDLEDKPGWLTEAESMIEETGLRCVVCHEGRTLQPKELLALYTFTKKVVLPSGKNTTRSSIDGTDLLKALPSKIPVNLIDHPFSEEWFRKAFEAKSAIQKLPVETSQSASRRNAVFVTTTSAGNAIHFSCHRRAKQADRTHPKAPKSEWEGASLRNNRVKCNCALPLISSRDSAVPLVDVNTGLSDYQSAVTSVVGSSFPCMLWYILHDIRFLLLRIAYGESLNTDSGGGSLASNCQLLFHQMHLAETFAKQADVELKDNLLHAQGLSAGCLLACGIVFAENMKKENSDLLRAVADGALMGAITSIIFHNAKPCGGGNLKVDIQSDRPHPKREWLMGRDLFLRSLIVCAGRRHVLNLDSSGCLSGRTLSGRKRSSSFAEWDNTDEEKEAASPTEAASSRSKAKGRRRAGRSSGRPNMPSVDDFQNAFRPMITLFAVLDQLSAEFTQTMSDIQIEASSQRMVQVIEDSQASRGIQELLRKAKVPLDNGQMISLLQRGMVLG